MNAVAPPSSPYKGLAAFEDSEVDALLFFGRDRDSQVIAANLMASRLTVLFGPTGVGKTSVLRAGVAYRLRREAGVHILVYSSWPGDPVAGIVEAAGGGAGGSLPDALAAAAARAGGDLYLILDQFEEFFLYHERDPRFVEALAEVVRRPGLRVNVLIGIREDALAQLDAFKAVIPNLLSNRLRLDRLDRPAGEAAILGPVDRYNELVPAERRMEIEPELVTAVLDQVAAGRVELAAVGKGVVTGAGDADRIEAPYLQLVMSRLWEVETEHGGRTLRRQTLDELGGAAQIVEDHLEHAMAELSPRQKDAAAAMYNFLVTPSGSKIAHGVRDLAGYAELDEEEAVDVLRRLADERIVRASAENGAATRYEIYHDVLADAVAAWRNRHGAERALHEAERRRRRAFFVATAALVGLILVAGIALFALVERRHSRSDARRAHARELASAAVSEFQTNPQQSIRLALRAAQLEPGTREEEVLRDSLRFAMQRAVFPVGSPVREAAFDPRGGQLLVASDDGRLRLYRFGGTRPERILDQKGAITAASYSPSGNLILSAGRDGTARVWRTSDGALLQTLEAGGVPQRAFFGRRSEIVVTLAGNGLIRVWRTRDGKLLLTIRTRGTAVPRSGALDSSGRRLVTVANDRFARVYSLDTGLLVGVLRQNGFVTSVSFSPGGRFIVTSGYEGEARLWNARTFRLVRKLFGPKSALTQAVFSPDGKLVAAAKNDGTTRVWQVASGFQSAILLGHPNQVTRVAFSPLSDALVTGSSDGAVRTWDINGKPIALLAGHTAAVTAVAYSRDGRTVLTASEDGTARLWDPGTEPDLTVRALERAPTKLALSPDRSRIVVGDEHGFAHIRAVRNGRLLGTLRTPGPVSAVAFGPAGPTAASLPTTSLAYSLDGRWSAVGRSDGLVVLRNLRRGTPRLLRPHGGPVKALAFDHEGNHLASGTENGAVQIWEARSGRLLHALRRHTRAVTSVAFSPNGALLVTASLDKDVRLWDAGTGRHRQLLRWHFGPVEGAAFSPDGRWVVTAGPSTAGVGLVATGRRVLFLRKHDRPLVGAVFAGQDGRLIVTAGRDGRIRSYQCDLCGRVDELIVLAKHRLAAQG